MGAPYAYVAAAAFLGLLLGVLLYSARPSAQRTAATLITGNLLLWLGGEVMVMLSRTPFQAGLWVRITYAVIAVIPFSAHHFVAVIDDPNARRHRVARILTASFAVVTPALVATALVINGTMHDGIGFHRVSGPFFPEFALTLFALLGLDVGLAVYAARCAQEPHQRLRCQYVLLGIAACIVLGALDLGVLQPLGFRAYHMFLTPLGVTVGTAAMIYAIATTRLVDVPTAMRRVAVNTGLLAALLVPCLGISLLAEQLMTGDIALGPSFVTAALFCVAGFGFPRLRVAAEQSLEQLLFGVPADQRRLLKEASREITTVLSLQTLAAATRSALSGAFGDVQTTIWLLKTDGLLPIDDDADPVNDPAVVSWVTSATEPVVLSEVEDGTASPIVAPLRARGIEVSIGLRVKDKAVGLLTIGPRGDQRLYTDDDIALLATLANQVAISLENARLYEELRTSREQVSRASRLSALGTLAAGLAHEIRNPLVAVKTFIDLLPTRLDDPDFLSHFRDLSLGEMRRVNNLLTDLLALGKSASAEYRVVDPAATLEPVLRLMDSTAHKRQVKLTFRAIGAIDPVWADPDQMKQIVLNLVLNAIEASPQGGDVAVTVRTGPRGGAILEVSDSGTGIPHEQIEHIFDPFFTTKESGTGLGLALVHQIVLEHGGEISVDSIPGRGSRFRISLPAAPAVLRPTGT